MDTLLLFKAVLMGLVEGFTEFLPVSSTGHLILFGSWIEFGGTDDYTFEIVIQLGAILAVCWLYRRKLWDVAISLPHDPQAQRFVRNVLIAFLPSAVIGAFTHRYLTTHLFTLPVIAIAMVVGGVVILAVERQRPAGKYHAVEDFPLKLVWAIGFIQVLSLIPGVSRSGATIIGALMLGADRKAAAEFSFFLAIPTMLGATVFSLASNYTALSLGNIEIILVGFVSAFVSAAIVVKTLIGFVSRHGFAPFAWYRIGLGLLVLWVLFV